MCDNIVLKEATVGGDTGKLLVELLEQIKEQLLPTKDERNASPICVRDENRLHWRDVVQPRPSGLDSKETSAKAPHAEAQRTYVEFKYKYSSPFNMSSFRDKVTKEMWRQSLDQCLGEAWKIPDDGRISLSFIHQTMFEDSNDGKYMVPRQLSFPWCHEKCTEHVGNNHSADSCMEKDPISDSTRDSLLCKRLLHLREFNEKQGPKPPFSVIDRDPCTGKKAYYYLRTAPNIADGLDVGNNAFQAALDRQYAGRISNQAPWKRLILSQGLASLPPDTWDDLSPSVSKPVYPYFTANSDSKFHQLTWVDLMGQHLKLHVKLERRAWNRSANPYIGHLYRNGFHITFFEIIKDLAHDPVQSQWPTGRLLINDIGNQTTNVAFQESAFTMLMQLPNQKTSSPQQKTFIPHPFFTVVILAPKGFWISPEEKWSSPDASSILHNSSAEIAEVDVIRTALGRVVERWIELNTYLENLLAEKFMIPEDYVKLLFDDENFTRSQKYFWAIGCLTEFITSISDNKAQWDLYRAARVEPIFQLNNAAALFNAAKIKNINEEDPWNTENESEDYEYERYQGIVANAQVYADTLADIKAQFESKLERVKALRDGLFNASALVESRASTRLGEHVKLLTYVSIFYLPLAFCASIWAIPNILQTKTNTTSVFIGTSISVGIATYAVVLNIDTIASKVLKNYNLQKRKAILQMQSSSDGEWRSIGQRFEAFGPVVEKKVPSEWWILVFVLGKLPESVRALWGMVRRRIRGRQAGELKGGVGDGEQEFDITLPAMATMKTGTSPNLSQHSQTPLTSRGREPGNSSANRGNRNESSAAHLPDSLSNYFRIFARGKFQQIKNYPANVMKRKNDGVELRIESV